MPDTVMHAAQALAQELGTTTNDAVLRGSVEYLVGEEELVEPVLGRWDVESE